MAGTLNDFLKESELFPYSKENYDLIKEASELNIAAMYLENQTFMTENADIIVDQEAGYMMESADPEATEKLEDKVSSKKSKWAVKAKSIWEKIIKAFRTFWKAVVARWDKLTAKAADVKKNLGVAKLTPEQIAAVTKLVNDAVKSSGIPISDKQRQGTRGLPKNIITISEDSVKNRLAAVLCNSTIELVPTKVAFAMAFSEKQLKEFFSKISDKTFLAGHKEALASVTKKMNDFQATNLTKGISISRSNEEVKKLIEDIEAAEKKITDEIMQDEDNNYTHAVGDVTTLFANAQRVTGDSIKLYTTVIRYQELVLNGLDAIVKRAPSAKPEAKPE